MSIQDEVKYTQISEDWRNRDNLTWQIPSVLVVIGGILIVSIYGKSEICSPVRDLLLWIGAIFSGILTITLGQNLYFQTVGEDLMDQISQGQAVKADRIPRRMRNGPGFWQIVLNTWLKAGSSLLFMQCVFVTGIFAFLLSGFKCVWGIVGGVLVVLMTLGINYLIFRRCVQN